MNIEPQEFFDSALERHLDYLRNIKEENVLICVVITYHKNSRDQLKMFHIHTEGQKPINAVKPLIYKTQPDYYVTFAEGWSWEITKDEMAKYSLVDLKKMKPRKEILSCFGRTKDGTAKFDKAFEVLRLDGRVDFVEYKNIALQSGKLP